MARQLSVEIYPNAWPFAPNEVSKFFSQQDAAFIDGLRGRVSAQPLFPMHGLVVRSGEIPLLLMPIRETQPRKARWWVPFARGREVSVGIFEPEIPAVIRAKEVSRELEDEALALAVLALQSFAHGLGARVRGRELLQSPKTGA